MHQQKQTDKTVVYIILRVNFQNYTLNQKSSKQQMSSSSGIVCLLVG